MSPDPGIPSFDNTIPVQRIESDLLPAYEREQLYEAAYTDPNGIRYTFQYRDLSRSSERKVSAHIYPFEDGAELQDFGVGIRRFPMQLYITGDGFENTATALFDSLELAGRGILEHPVYGTFSVIPAGEIKRNDALATADGQAVFEVEFWETITPPAPLPPATALIRAAEDKLVSFVEVATTDLENKIEVVTPTESVSLAGRITGVVSTIKKGLRDFSKTVDSVQSEFDAAVTLIEENTYALIETPLLLGQHMYDLIRAPTLAAETITAKFSGYRNLFNDLIAKTIAETKDNRGGNEFAFQFLTVNGVFVATVESAFRTSARSRQEILNVTDGVVAMLADYAAWVDANTASTGAVLDSDAYLATLDTVLSLLQALTVSSYALRSERRLILGSPRNLLELSSEIYGTDWEIYLDEIINTNRLTPTEILEIPMGRTLVFQPV